jgi:hypothetical protein
VSVLLLLDEHVPRALARALAQHGLDVLHVADTPLRGLPDEALLAEASRIRRALVTYNVRDFAALAVGWAKEDREHFGLLLVARRRPIGELVQRLLRTLEPHSPDSLRNTVLYI